MEMLDTTRLSKEGANLERDSFGSESDGSGTSSADDEESEAKRFKSSENCREEHVKATPENQNANQSNVARSPTKNSSSLEKSDSKENKDSSDEVVDANDSSKVKTIVFSPNWSESLSSPTDLLGFSPSESGSCHGLGLQLAVERSVNTGLFLDNVSLFLSSTTTLYEQLGVKLIKIAQFVRPQQLSLETSINDDFQSLYQDILSMGSGFRLSAEWYRTSIIAPLKSILSTNGTERDASFNRYKKMRQESVEARKLALANYSRTTSATKTAEAEIEAWFSKLQQNRKHRIGEELEETGGTIDVLDKSRSWEKSLKLIAKEKNEEETTICLIQKLKLVQSCRIQYSESVEKENNCVTLSEENEALALHKAQKAEEDQINFFVKDILSQIFPKDENGGSLPGARNDIALSDIDRPFGEGIEKKGIVLLSNLNLFKQQIVPYEDGMGVMDAATLGLPETLGVQRDKIKSSFSARENRIEVTEIVIQLFEQIADVTSKSSFRMRSQITNQRRKEDSKGLSTEPFYSSTFRSLWRTILSVFEDEAKLISETAFKIFKLEKWLTTSKKILESEIEVDDAAWKRVCDAARAEIKFESKYKQTKQHVEKVRQRASSKELSLSQRGSSGSSDDIPPSLKKRNDSSGSIGIANRSSSGTQLTPSRVRGAFFKGGEAMKKLTENAMVQIAQISMNEVDQKEAKDQLAFEEASTEKKKSIFAYASCTKERTDKIDSEDDSGWIEIKEIVMKLAQSIRALKTVRCTVFQNRISQDLENSFQVLIANTEKWSKHTREKIHQSKLVSSSTSCPERALSNQPIKSDSIDVLLELTEKDLERFKRKFDIESTDERSEDLPVDSREDTTPSGRGVQSNNASNEEVEKPKESMVQPLGNDVNISESEEKLPFPIRTDPRDVTGKEVSPEIKAFVTQFWSKKHKDQKVPTIIDIHTCAYRPKERITFLTPNLQGRLYTTKEAIYFLAAEKNFTLEWESITSVEREKGFMGSNNENDLVVSYRSGNTISSFLLCRLKDRDNIVANLRRLKAENEKSEVSHVSESISATTSRLLTVPPDLKLKDMEIVLSKTIKNVSVESIFENVWADRTESESFYGSWLMAEGCFDIGMKEWEIAEAGNKYRNEWCDEKYDQQRLVTFKFNRTTLLYIGAPVAFVKQRQFLRVEENDKCVLAISAEFEGIPYADTFAVENRWVATRTGANDVVVQVGLFVNFKKSTMLKSQIKSGTITETKNVHSRLFGAVKKACTNSKDSESNIDDDKDEEVVEENGIKKAEKNILAWLGNYIGSLDVSTIVSAIGAVALLFTGRYFTRAIFGDSGRSDIQRLENHIQELLHDVRALHKSIDLVTVFLKDIKCKEM